MTGKELLALILFLLVLGGIVLMLSRFGDDVEGPPYFDDDDDEEGMSDERICADCGEPGATRHLHREMSWVHGRQEDCIAALRTRLATAERERDHFAGRQLALEHDALEMKQRIAVLESAAREIVAAPLRAHENRKMADAVERLAAVLEGK